MVFGTSVIENMKVALTLLIEELSKEFELYLGVDDEAILSIWRESTNWRLKLLLSMHTAYRRDLDISSLLVDIKSFQERLTS